jgi:hypothetical protein
MSRIPAHPRSLRHGHRDVPFLAIVGAGCLLAGTYDSAARRPS